MRKGYTLVEMLVAMALFAILMTMSYAVILTSQKINTRSMAMRDTQTEARNIIDLISRDIKSDTFCSLEVKDSKTLEIKTAQVVIGQDTYSCQSDTLITKTYSYSDQKITLDYATSTANYEVNSSFISIPQFSFGPVNSTGFVQVTANFLSNRNQKNPYEFQIQTTISPELVT